MADPTIKKGSKGTAVKKAQRALNARGYDTGAVDGIFGAKTERQVKLYQADRGLEADGVIGPETWARLAPPTIKVSNDEGGVDLGDFQYFAFTLVTLTYFAWAFIKTPAAGLPPVPGTLLVLVGVSQATYVGKKGLLAAGPAKDP